MIAVGLQRAYEASAAGGAGNAGPAANPGEDAPNG